jgi:2-keto-3-deoxy-L-rhamnonate aldolase RhmA
MADYMAHANRETFIVVQIEDAEAVEEVDAIAAPPGIDILFVGPADLRQSYGIPLQFDHDLMRAAVTRVAEAAARHGKWWGLPGGNAEQGAIYYDMGARFLAAGGAILLLQQAYKQLRSDFDPILQR